jgi:hypothetical protein
MMNLTLYIKILLGFATLIIYIFTFIFLSGSSPKGDEHSKNVNKQCAKSFGSFVKTVFTWGYFKASFRRFKQYLLNINTIKATLGKQAPNAEVISLDGTKKTLFSIINAVPKDVPLILNMGSYT